MSHKSIKTDQTGGHPLDLQTLEFMQSGYNDCIMGLASAFGDNVIVSGVLDAGANYTNGWVIIGGELLPFVGGLKNTNIVVEETIAQALYEDGNSKDAEITRVAKCASTGGVAFSSFARLDKDFLKRGKSFTPLKTIVLEIGPWNMRIQSSKQITHSLDYKKIRAATITVIADDTAPTPYSVQNPMLVGVSYVSTDHLLVLRDPLDNVTFDGAWWSSTVQNRGFVTIQYAE